MGSDNNNDRALAKSALQKQLAGQKPTAVEAAALKRVERARDEEMRWAAYRAIPQKDWRTMSGRQTKVLQEQASRYGMPFGGATVDLPAVVRALHDFLAEKGRYLGGDDVDAKERKTRLEADRLQIKLDRERGEVVPIDQMHEGTAVAAGILRDAMMMLQKQYGIDAFKIMDDAVAEFERVIMAALPAAADEQESTGEPTDEAAAAE